MKMAKILKTNGKWSWRKISAALMVPVVMFCLNIAYVRYSWFRDQAYKIDTIIEAEESFKKKDSELQRSIDKLEADMEKGDSKLEADMKKGDGILHSRASKETDKREKGDERLLNLILDMLDSQQKSIKQQQEYMEQKTGK